MRTGSDFRRNDRSQSTSVFLSLVLMRLFDQSKTRSKTQLKAKIRDAIEFLFSPVSFVNILRSFLSNGFSVWLNNFLNSITNNYNAVNNYSCFDTSWLWYQLYDINCLYSTKVNFYINAQKYGSKPLMKQIKKSIKIYKSFKIFCTVHISSLIFFITTKNESNEYESNCERWKYAFNLKIIVPSVTSRLLLSNFFSTYYESRIF